MNGSTVKVTLNRRSYDVSLGEKSVTVDGREHSVDAVMVGKSSMSLLVDGVVSYVSIIDGVASDHHPAHDNIEGIPFRINVNGHVHEVLVDTMRTLLLKSIDSGAEGKSGPLEIRAPMPGLVAKVEVSVGDPISVGQGLVILEAMKMENEIRASQSGVISEIKVRPGQAVEKGEVLAVIAPGAGSPSH